MAGGNSSSKELQSEDELSTDAAAVNQLQIEHLVAGKLDRPQVSQALTPGEGLEAAMNIDTPSSSSFQAASFTGTESPPTGIGSGFENDEEHQDLGGETKLSRVSHPPQRAAARKSLNYKVESSEDELPDQGTEMETYNTEVAPSQRLRQTARSPKSTARKRAADEVITEANSKKAKQVRDRAQKRGAKQIKPDSATWGIGGAQNKRQD